MKRKLMIVLALLLAFALCACGTQKAVAEPPEENTVLPAPYFDLLERYGQAVEENWDREKCAEEGVNALVPVICSPEVGEKVGFALLDLDGDGVQELLIGPCDDSGLVLALYTRDGESAKEVFSGWERNSYVCVGDGRFYNHASNSAANSGDFLYSYADGELRFEEGVVIDGRADPDEPYFSVGDDSWDVSGAEKISEESFMLRTRGYQAMAQRIEWTEIA